MRKIKFLMMMIFALAVCSAYSQDDFKKEIISASKGLDEIKIYVKVQTQIYKVDNEKDSRIELYSKKGDFSIYDWDYYDGEFVIEYSDTYSKWLQKSNSRRRYNDLEKYSDERYIKIYTTDIDLLEAGRSSRVTVEDEFDYYDLSLRATSSGRIYMRDLDKIKVDGELNIVTSSSGRIELCDVDVNENIKITASSSGRLSIENVELGKELHISSSSSGRVSINSSSLKLNYPTTISVTSSSSVVFQGLEVAGDLTFRASSGGRITATNIDVDGNLSTTVSSSGKISVIAMNVGNKFNAIATSSGRVTLDSLFVENGVFVGQSSSGGRIMTQSGKIANTDSFNKFTTTSSGYINFENILMSKASVAASSGGDIFVNVSKELNIKQISSGGYVGYKKKTPMFSITGAGIPGLKAID